MKISKFAAMLLAAGLLSACAFTPPKPPLPRDTERQTINKFDPRFYTHAAAAVQVEPVVAVVQPTDSIATPVLAQETMPQEKPADTPQVELSLAQATNDAFAPTKETEPAPAPEAIAQVDVPAADVETPAHSEPHSIDAQSVDVVATVTTVEAVSEQQPEEPGEPATLPQDEQPQEPAPPPTRYWNIEISDGTVRQGLQRWAQADGWIFGPDQWLLNWDLPIEAPAQFEAATFQEAAQALAKAISLSESPINVCFYDNQVLRVVPYNQRCDRTQSQPGGQ